ncbi:MAG: serine/threonine protein kinase, partial [Planctomycetota bacterium]
YAHENNVIHRDVKPGNFMVTLQGRLKILDFGLAKETTSERDLTVVGSVFGTPNYISPEAVHDAKSVDARSDIFSLGATLYQAATGRPPFDGLNAILIMEQVCKKEPEAPAQVNSKLCEGLNRVILHCLEKTPDDRYASAQDLEADLKRVQKGEEPLARPPKRKAKGSPSGRRARSSRRVSARGGGLLSRILGFFGLGKK